MTAPFSEFGPFAVGEICRIVHSDSYPELIGREVTITDPCQRLIETNTGVAYDGYRTDLTYKGFRVAPPESYLRRRRPPAADSGERMFMQQLYDLAGRLRQGVPA